MAASAGETSGFAVCHTGLEPQTSRARTSRARTSRARTSRARAGPVLLLTRSRLALTRTRTRTLPEPEPEPEPYPNPNPNPNPTLTLDRRWARRCSRCAPPRTWRASRARSS
eukprot:scaffold60104_cov43-Phaeocystis_antarctica.AAC.1